MGEGSGDSAASISSLKDWDIGFEVSQPRSSDELSKSLRTDYERVGAILKAINFKPE